MRLSSLSPITRQRLVAASRRDDLVLLRCLPLGAALHRHCAAAALASAAALALVWPDGALASRVEPAGHALVAASIALASFSAFTLALRWREARSLGFPCGTYLFARDLVVASGEGLLIMPTDELERVVVRGRRLLFSFKGGARWSVPHRGEDPLALEAEIQEARAEAERWEGTDAAEQYDPLDADRGLPGEGVAPARRPAVALSLGALACLALGVAASRLIVPRFELHREQQALERLGSEGIPQLQRYLDEARARGDARRAAMAERAWFEALARWAGKGSRAPGVLEYALAGGREVAAAVALLKREQGLRADDATYAALFRAIAPSEEAASSLLESLGSPSPRDDDPPRARRYGALRWLGVHGMHCDAHRREYLSRVIDEAARPSIPDIELLRVIAGERDRSAASDLWAPDLFIDEIPAASRAQASAALDALFARAEEALRGSALAPPVQAGFVELVKRARKGKPSAVFLGAIDPANKASIPLGQMLRNSGGPLCNGLFERILPPVVKEALFSGFKVEYIHHQQECLVATQDPSLASVVLRCSSKNHPAADTGEFLLDRCELTFPGAPSAGAASATFAPPVPYRHFWHWRYPEYMLASPEAFVPGPDFNQRDREELEAGKAEYLRTLAAAEQLWRALGSGR